MGCQNLLWTTYDLLSKIIIALLIIYLDIIWKMEINLCYNRFSGMNYVMLWIRDTCQGNGMISIHDVSPSLEKKISFLSAKSLLYFMDKVDPTLEMVTASVLCMYTFIISTRVHRITFFLNRNIVNLVNDYFLLIILIFIRFFLSNV